MQEQAWFVRYYFGSLQKFFVFGLWFKVLCNFSNGTDKKKPGIEIIAYNYVSFVIIRVDEYWFVNRARIYASVVQFCQLRGED